MRLHEEGFDDLVQRRVEDITNIFELIHPGLLSNLSELRQRPSSKALEHLTNMEEYKELITTVLSTTGTRSQMVVNYWKDVSNILVIVSSTWTGSITQHLQAERQIPKLIFVFDHINCVSYNSFQHAFLNNPSKDSPQAFDDLLKYGFGATSSGESFSTMHGDLVTECFNKESKGTAGTYQSGCISNHNMVYKWIVTLFIQNYVYYLTWKTQITYIF